MAGWNSVFKEIKNEDFQSPLDTVRKRHIKELAELTGRNVICYYSGFLNCDDNIDISINDRDLNGFMTVIHNLDKTKGLDLIIHSPGGDVTATEAIGDYLRKVFGGDIRIFVPQLAMSGGTMLSCIGNVIYMGKHSSIGPIDPQYNGVPAHGVIQEYEQAKKEVCENPNTIVFWQNVISKYPAAFIGQCYKAIELSSDVLKKWLKEGNMFDGDSAKDKKIEKIMKFLNNNEYTKIHSRHIGIDKAIDIGLKIKPLEDDSVLQDAILTVHHCYMHTFQNTKAVKIIENQNDVSFILNNN